MVGGIEQFRKHFVGYADRYVLIGGTASALSMEALGVDFRATKDLDIVLCVEALDKEFVQAFWQFIRAGGYNCQNSTGKKLFYRFHSPKDPHYPKMLELFSRAPNALNLADEAYLTPIPVDAEVSSLSAILLNDAYYTLIHQYKQTVNGLTYIGPECLIPLKARAYMDTTNRKQAGEIIDTKTIKKHRNDIFRLFSILDPTVKTTLHPTVKNDLKQAFDLLRNDQLDLNALGISGTTSAQVLKEMTQFYEIID